jgi:hypothetical protein
VTIKSSNIWHVIPCSLVEVYWHIDGIDCLHLQSRRVGGASSRQNLSYDNYLLLSSEWYFRFCSGGPGCKYRHKRTVMFTEISRSLDLNVGTAAHIIPRLVPTITGQKTLLYEDGRSGEMCVAPRHNTDCSSLLLGPRQGLSKAGEGSNLLTNLQLRILRKSVRIALGYSELGIGSIWLKIGTGGGLMWTRWWTSGFHKMLGSSRIAAQLAASQEGPSSMSEWVNNHFR